MSGLVSKLDNKTIICHVHFSIECKIGNRKNNFLSDFVILVVGTHIEWTSCYVVFLHLVLFRKTNEQMIQRCHMHSPHENKSNTANRNLHSFFLSLPSCSLPLSGAQNPVKTGRLQSGCTAGGQGLQSARRLLPSCSVLLAAALASTSPFTPVTPQSSMAFPPFLLCSKKKRKKTCGLNVCIEMSPRVLITWTLL